MELRLNKLFVVLISFIFLPSFINVVAGASSMALGVFVSCLISIIISGTKLPRLASPKFIGVLIIGLVVTHMIVYLFVELNDFSLKKLLSWIILLLMVISGYFSIKFYEKETNIKEIINWIGICIFCFAIIGVFVKFPFLGYGKYKAAVFPFSEPSHLAINTSAIFFALALFSKGKKRALVILLVLVLGASFPSLIFIVLGLLMIGVFYVKNSISFLIISIIIISLFILIVPSTDFFTYFIQRLSFGKSSTNLTALVYMQGWEDTIIALKESNGLGIGFQNMGILPPGNFGKIILRIAHTFKNRNDGGFLAAKIICEFGVIGILIIGYYLLLFYRSVLFIRKITVKKSFTIDEFKPALLFSHCIVIVFFIEIFARGYGYFSPGGVLFIMALFIQLRYKLKCKEIVNA